MNLQEYLLAYPGFSAEPGVCHVVVASDAPDGPAVLVGALEDNPGTSPTNALERVTCAIAQHLFEDQCDFRLYQYEPQGLPDLKPTFYVISWNGESRSTPTWEQIDPADDEFLKEAQHSVKVDPYTMGALAGRTVIDATESAVVTDLRAAAPGS